MLTGQKPHQADSPIQVAYKHVHEDIPAAVAADALGIPPYVDALVARATARDTALRPADARVLLHQVRRVRHALDHGVVDDPELIADLDARTTPRSAAFADTDRRAARADHRAARSSPRAARQWTDDVYDQEREPTSTWPAPPRRAGRGPAPAPERPRPAAAAAAPAPVAGADADPRAAAGHCAAGGAGRLVLRRRPLHLDTRRDQHDQRRPPGSRLDQAGLDIRRSTDRPTPRPSRKGFVVSHRPRARRPGAQGRHGRRGRSRSAPSATRCPTCAGRTLDDAQQMLQDAQLGYGARSRSTRRRSPRVA